MITPPEATSSQPMAKPKLLLDCDPGHDDAMAIALAARHGELLGITTVSGNVALDLTTANALTTCEVFGIDIEVHSGADRSLLGQAPDAAEIHGRSGLDGPAHPSHGRRPASSDGVEFLIETIRANPGTWLVPVGPMTNVALALRSAPDLVDSLAGISFMGGSAGPGNVTATAEFNVWADPEAAAVVIGCGHPDIRMAGLQLTRFVQVDDELLETVAGIDTDRARWARDLLGFYLDSVERVKGRRHGSLHDPVAIAAVTHPHLISYRHLPVTVECSGTHTRGMTVVDKRQLPGATPNVAVGKSADGTAILALVVEALGGSALESAAP